MSAFPQTVKISFTLDDFWVVALHLHFMFMALSDVHSFQDIQHLAPATDFYKKLALDCSSQQVAVDLFLLSAQYCDLASLGKSHLNGLEGDNGGKRWMQWIFYCFYHVNLLLKNPLIFLDFKTLEW